jgi:hypothetical protein
VALAEPAGLLCITSSTEIDHHGVTRTNFIGPSTTPGSATAFSGTTPLAGCKREYPDVLTGECVAHLVKRSRTKLIRMHRRLSVRWKLESTPENICINVTVQRPYEGSDVGVPAREIGIGVEQIIQIETP